MGTSSANGTFTANLTYNKKGTNAKGQITVYVQSCNNADGSIDPNCSAADPATWHTYFIKSNAISYLAFPIKGTASFGSKTNVYEVLPNGSKIGLDGGGTMQVMVTMPGQELLMPWGGTNTCTNPAGCAAVSVYKSSGGVWYSSSWGAPAGGTPQPYEKFMSSGSVSIQ
jgi:hypothetical protein